MNRFNRLCDHIAAWMGIFGVDWDADFNHDGYTDPLGRAALEEPLWLSDLAQTQKTPAIRLVHTSSHAGAKRA